MPNVRASSGTIGTMSLPIVASLMRWRSMLTKTCVVATSRGCADLKPSKSVGDSAASGCERITRRGTGPPRVSRRWQRYWIYSLSAAGR